MRDFKPQADPLAANLFLQRGDLGIATRRQDRDFAGAIIGNNDSQGLSFAFE